MKTAHEGRMRSEPTSAEVVDRRDLLERGNFLLGFAVEDADVFQVTEVSGRHLLDPGLVHIKVWLLGEHEDLVVPLDVQLDLGGAALSIDAINGEVVDVGGLCRGDHGQVDHCICGTGRCVGKSCGCYQSHKELDFSKYRDS